MAPPASPRRDAAPEPDPQSAPEGALERPPVSSVVAAGLRAAILDGGLRDGAPVRQEDVAARFGVSQTMAREAFKQLVAEGFLVALPRRGVRVAALSVDEAQEITQL